MACDDALNCGMVIVNKRAFEIRTVECNDELFSITERNGDEPLGTLRPIHSQRSRNRSRIAEWETNIYIILRGLVYCSAKFTD